MQFAGAPWIRETDSGKSLLIPQRGCGRQDKLTKRRFECKALPSEASARGNFESEAGNRRMNKYEIIIYWSSEDGVFVAEIPELAGCSAHGETQQSALENALEAIG